MNWLACTGGGRRHWGRDGAAGLLVSAYDDGRTYVLLDERADWVHHGGTFGVPGGAIHSDETAYDAALREVSEEVRGLEGVKLDVVLAHEQRCTECMRWAYTTFLATIPARVDARARSMESEAIHWVDVEDVATLQLHPGFKLAWPSLREALTAQE